MDGRSKFHDPPYFNGLPRSDSEHQPVSKRSAKSAKRRRPNKSAPAGAAQPDSDGEVVKDAYLRDKELIDRCLGGEVDAWEELYAQCHPPLLVSVRILLGHGPPNEDLVDEIAAQVWYALVANDGALLAKYEVTRGARLITFVRTIAKDMVGRHFRSEQRRILREKATLLEKPRHRTASGVAQPVASLQAFMSTLSPVERNFCGDYLLATPAECEDQAEKTYSPANARQLSSRIQRKLLEFVKSEP